MTDTQGQSLDTLLNGPPPEVSQEASAAPVEMGDKPDASAPPAAARELEDGPLVPRKALEDERRKRQDYEKRFADLEAQIRANQPRQQQPEPQQAPQDWWTDPEAAAAHQRQEFQFQIYETRLLLGEELLSSKEDYEPAKAAFIQAANQDIGLARKMVSSRNPAKFAYETGKKILAQSEVGDDLNAYKAKLHAEWEAERGQAPSTVTPSQKTPAPKSLAGQPSAQPRDTSGRFQGPSSLQDILGG